MTATEIISQFEQTEQNQEEFNTVTTTYVKQVNNKFPGKPFVEIRPIHSVAQTSVKYVNAEAKNYYLPASFQSWSGLSWLPRLYKLGAFEEEVKEINTGNIAIHVLAKSIAEQNISFVPSSAGRKYGKFSTSSASSLSNTFPRSQSKFKNFESSEEEAIWRGVFPLSHKKKILFSKEIEVKVDKLPTWKPHIVIDSYRLEDDDE